MQNFADQLFHIIHLIQLHLPTLLIILAAIWGINIINWMLKGPLFILGIRPRTFSGLFGIAFAPFIHKNFSHLFYNSIPLLLLASGTLIFGWEHFIDISITIIVVSGVLTWLLGRRGNHIGASGLIMGYWAYLLALSFFWDSAIAFLVGFIALYYFGGLAANLLPTEEKVSWEGHVFGFIAGIVAARELIPTF